MNRVTILAVAPALLSLMAFASDSAKQFGTAPAGEPVELYTLTNSRHMEVAITTYGATIVSLRVPDRQGNFDDVVLGYGTLDEYVHGPAFFGATVGRYANRIAGAKFSLDGHTYTLDRNNGQNSLHGGSHGFDKRVWRVQHSSPQSLEMLYLSPDGEGGFPGNLRVTVTFTLTDANELRIDYSATTDQATVVNLTNHSYFNLAGQGNGDVLRHAVEIHASKFTPVDKALIPTGELRSVKGTPFDFLEPHTIGERIEASDEQLRTARGYDHNFVLSRTGASPELAARVTDPANGRVLEVLTTEPGVQFYTSNTMNVANGKNGKKYGNHGAFCLETQHFPDSPNQSSFPSTALRPGEQYRSTTIYRFGVAP
jgi:aldose 1-epimerase